MNREQTIRGESALVGANRRPRAGGCGQRAESRLTVSMQMLMPLGETSFRLTERFRAYSYPRSIHHHNYYRSYAAKLDLDGLVNGMLYITTGRNNPEVVEIQKPIK